jgi:ADP-heptose:LPS heptosyltransferase
MSHALVVRQDRLGDVLVCGPAVRAVAAGCDRVTMLVSPAGAEAARLLPGVDDVLVWDCPWIGLPPAPVDRADVDRMIDRLAAAGVDRALVLTSFHQSALPTALLLRMAGVPEIAAVSTDYPGDLLTARLADPPEAPEPVRMLAVAEAAGYRLPAADDGRLLVRLPPALPGVPSPPYVVVHPGVDAPARAYPAECWQAAAAELTAAGRTVVVTGTAAESALAAAVAGAAEPPGRALDLAGATDLGQLAGVLARADVVVAANTGPAHLAAAVGTPVVSLFAPVVPAARWAPYGVPVVLLGDQNAACRGTRARTCNVPGHPCLSTVRAEDVRRAVDALAPAREVSR